MHGEKAGAVTPQPTWTAGNYNAWAAEPLTRKACNERLQQVPEQYRADVIRHLKTVWAIRDFYGRKGKTA